MTKHVKSAAAASRRNAGLPSPSRVGRRRVDYAISRGWKILEVYDLAGVSGKSVADHPETKRMMADIKRGHIQALVFTKLARLTRNARELMEFSDFFQTHHADLVSLGEQIDTSTPAGRLFFNLVGCMAQWEREEITDRIRSSVLIRAKQGKPLSGSAPYGYTWKDKKLVVQPDEAPIRLLVYELFDEVKRLKTVARMLNERGYRTRNGKMWSDTTVRYMVRDPTAKGLHRQNYSASVGKRMVIKPESEHIFNGVEAIVPAELWERCNAHLDGRYVKRDRRPGKTPAHIYSGFVTCHCGGKMYVPMKTAKYICQKCRNKIGCQDLDEIFMEELKGYLVKDENVQAYFNKAGAALSEKQALLEQRRSETTKLEEDKHRMLRLYLDGNIGGEDFKAFNDPIVERRRQLDAELERVQGEIDVLTIDSLSSEQIAAEALNLHSRWPEMTLEEKRRVAELMVRSIVVGDGDITFNLIQLPSYQDFANRQSSHLAPSRCAMDSESQSQSPITRRVLYVYASPPSSRRSEMATLLPRK